MLRVVFVALVCVAVPAYAADSKMERGYALWTIGYGQNGYPLDLQEALDELSYESNVGHYAISTDVLGLYIPLGEQTLVGIITNANYDVYTLENFDSEVDVYNYISGASFIHFPNAKIGDGGFIRVDAGMAFVTARVISEDEENYTESDIGIGVLAGGGWAYPIREGTRFMAGLNFAIRRVEKSYFTSLGVNIGALF